MKDRLKTKLGRGLLVLAGCAIGAVGAEGVLRAAGTPMEESSPLRGYHSSDPTLGWVGTPNRAAHFANGEFEVFIANDDEGFRRHENAFGGAPDAPVTAFLGDSFTWGWGVEQGEVFSDLLQAALGDTTRIVNRGVNAYGTTQQRLLLDRVLENDAPDRVTLLFFANDPLECSTDRGGKRPFATLASGELAIENVPVRRRLTGPLRELSKRSVVLSNLRASWNRWTLPLRDPENVWLEADLDAEPEGWEVCRAVLLDLRDACESAGVAFELVYVPLVDEVTVPEEDDALESRLHELVRELCAEAELRWLDLTPGLREAWRASPARADDGRPLYYPIDMHWTAEGHTAASRLIEEWWSGPTR